VATDGVARVDFAGISAPSSRPPARTLVRWWVVAVVVVIGVFAFRAIVDQPCAAPAICVVPPAHLAIKPLLLLLAAVTVGGALISTIVRSIRALIRRSGASLSGRLCSFLNAPRFGEFGRLLPAARVDSLDN
jgi:hypothetical protein